MSDAFAAGLAAILDRDLRGLRRELEAYPDERQIWQPVPGLPNTAGTLALHLAGNLQHYVGARWGGTGYVRNRAAEFARRDVPRAELLAEIDRARAAVKAALASDPRRGARRGLPGARGRVPDPDRRLPGTSRDARRLSPRAGGRAPPRGDRQRSRRGDVQTGRARECAKGLAAADRSASRSSSPRSPAARNRCRAPGGPAADPAHSPSAGPTCP